jgi:hypothetical protein
LYHKITFRTRKTFGARIPSLSNLNFHMNEDYSNANNTARQVKTALADEEQSGF